MKKLIPAYILSFVISFMLFIYEPITMYANNINDFWFDLSMIITPIIIIFIIIFLILSMIFTIVFFVNKRFSKKKTLYNVLLIILFIIFFASYIQGNYLIGNLPRLDGTEFEWNKYRIDNIITIIIWIIIIIAYIVTTIKFKFEKVINASKYIVLAVFGMLSVSLISTMLTTDNIFIKKDIYNITTNNIDNVSTDKNLFIFVVDSIDSRIFDKILNKSKYKNTFEDFTYYPDTLSGYAYTRDSIPLILTGEWNENKTDFIEYYKQAMDNSLLLKTLKEKEYDINIYEEDIMLNDATSVNNIEKVKGQGINTFTMFKQEIKYILFKYLPYNLKKYSQIQKLYFEKDSGKYEFFHWYDIDNYNRLKSNKITKVDNKYFQFIHLEGAHIAYDLDENMNSIKNGTYEQKLGATLTIINTFINKLKENNVYDNSAIVILSDHGYNIDTTQIEGRQNPILYIKGINEHHKMNISDKPISYEDLTNAYLDLLDGKKSTELFKNISNKRTRRYLLYAYAIENHMVEYEQTGKAWDLDTLKKTGREFNR